MLDKDDWKIALEDARYRHNAILGLIHAADNQALALMRLYVTIGTAAAAGAVSTLPSQISIPLTCSLVGAASMLAFGAWQCFSVIAGADINLPGRGADFWLWAAGTNKDRVEVFKEYLTTLAEKHQTNNRLNERQTKILRRAKLSGILSPIVALVFGGAAELMLVFGLV